MPYTMKRVSENQAGFPGIPNSISGQFGSFVPSLGSLGDTLGSNFGNVLSGGGGNLGNIGNLIGGGGNIGNLISGGNIGNLISQGGNIKNLINQGGNIKDLINQGANIKDLISGGANIGNIFGGGKPPFGIPSDIKGTYHYINRILRSGQEGTSPYHPATTVFNLGERGSGFRKQTDIQDFYKIRDECLAEGKLWEDPEFEAADSSIFFSRGPPKPFEWKRPMEISDDPQLFVEGATRFDVQQGELGDCWLLAAVANLTLQPTLFHQVVPDDQGFDDKYAGIFHFRFWQYGRWVDVCVDDRLPTCYGQLVYLHSSQSNEFWSALLEKAYAKLHGSYEALKGGSTSEAMEDFTGGITENYDLEKAPPHLFQILLKAYERNSLMGCSIEPDPSVTEMQTRDGLVKGHAYSITRVQSVDINTPNMSGKIPLLRLRNPWGNEAEWNGPWSDKSPEWRFIPEHEKQEIGLVFENDGEFWMSYRDFIKHFMRLEICNLNPDSLTEDELTASDKKRWEMSVFEGEWVRGVTAGGCRNYLQSFAHNPQYRITLTDVDEDDEENKCTIVIGLMQKNRRSQRRLGRDCLTVGFAVYRLEDPDNLPTPLDKNFFTYNASVARSPTFINMREVAERFTLPPGVYCIVPSTFEPNEEGEFLLRVFSEKKNNMEENDNEVGLKEMDDRIIEPPQPEPEVKRNDEKVREFFNKLAGEDLEVDWMELKEILDYAMRNEVSASSAAGGDNVIMNLLSLVCGTFFQDSPIATVFAGASDFLTDTVGKGGFSKDVCRSMIAMLDMDHSGKLGFDEFKLLWTDIRHWKQIYQLYSKETQGYLSSFELREALNAAGYSLNNHILNILAHRYANKEGKISFDDFIMCAIKLKTMIEYFKDKDPTDSNKAMFTLEEWVEKTLYS
ncbi:calpain-A isoform X3 [Macrosteles quadrilineatus]|uniref:calpain-A isoform X3 n=1 Tax=Macrosteles quadrilineatus TaxID=74068 RepID=UPI0023E2F03F|nr:calpain-A isoform X3 [Macrosteles quadrilineatus]